jgi:hypothetical protein
MSHHEDIVNKKDLQSLKEDIIQQFHIISEGLIDQIKLLSEGHTGIIDRLDRIEKDSEYQSEKLGV